MRESVLLVREHHAARSLEAARRLTQLADARRRDALAVAVSEQTLGDRA